MKTQSNLKGETTHDENRKTHLATFRMPLVLAMAAAPLAAAPVAADLVTEAIKDGEVSLSARYRYEFVDEDGIPNDAHASTIKTKLGYRTGRVSGFSGFLEAENVTAVGSENFASPTNNVANHPRVADPTETGDQPGLYPISGAWRIRTSSTVASSLPWITTVSSGHVGWRQNEQTFDAATVVNKSLADTTLTAGYIHNVNRLVSGSHRRGRRSQYAERHLQRTL